MRISSDDSRASLLAALRARRAEIDRVVLARVRAIGDGGDPGDAEYLDGLRHAIEAAIEHTLASIDRADDLPLPVPLPLLSQARLAARRRLPLETMLRRYLAGHAVLADFVAREAARQDVAPVLIAPILRSLAARTDLTVAAISAAYAQEQAAERPRSADRRRTELVRRLLGGALVDPAAIHYDLDRRHLGLVLRGDGARAVVEAIAASFDCRCLTVVDDDDSVWAWFGSREGIEPRSIAEAISAELASELRVGIGELGRGQAGWRLSHEQARAAFSVAVRGSTASARYAEVALLASVMNDELLSASLRRLYLEPLEAERDGGDTLRATLHAYFEAGSNISAAATVLGLNRRTVSNRLREAERCFGRPLTECAADVEISLRLESAQGGDARRGSSPHWHGIRSSPSEKLSRTSTFDHKET